MARPLDHQEGFVFAHSMLRESLERRATEAGRASALHQACAAALSRPGAPDQPGRVARHLILAGETDTGLDWLLRGVETALRRGDFLLAGGELLRARQLLMGRTDGGGERRLVHALVLSAVLQTERGALDDAELTARQALEIAERRGWTAARAEAHIRLVKVAYERGDAAEMSRGIELADAELKGMHAPRLVGELHALRASLLSAQGVRAEANEAYLRAEAAFAAAGDRLQVARCRMGRAMSTKQTGDFETALALAQESMQVYEEQGSRVGLADAWHNVGELERLRGNLGAAERSYREALAFYEAVGSADTAYAELNLGITLIEVGELHAAAPLLLRAMRTSERLGRRFVVAGCQLFLLTIDAHRADWAAFEAHLDAAVRLLEELGVVEIDMARGLERASRAAAAGGRPDLADRAARLATAHWHALGIAPNPLPAS